MRTSATLLLLCLCCAIAHAADITLGPERAVSLPDSAPAPFAQHAPSIASNGRDFLAVWIDPRAQNNGSAPHEMLYGTRLDEYGRPQDRFGHVIADSVVGATKVGSNGRGYLVAYFGAGGGQVLALDNDGFPVSSPTTIAGTWDEMQNVQIASNGDTYAIAHGASLTLASSNGAILWTKPLPTPTYLSSLAITNVGSTYAIAMSGNYCDSQGNRCVTEIHLIGATDAGVGASERVAYVPNTNGAVAVVAAGTRIAIAYDSDSYSGRTLNVWIVDGAKSVIAHRSLEGRRSCCDTALPMIAWDGSQFLVAWETDAQTGIDAVRLTPDGAIRDLQPIHIATGSAAQLSIASNGKGETLLWRDSARGAFDIVSRNVTRFDELASSPSQSVLVSAAPSLQTEVRVAPMGAGAITVWRELDVHSAIEAKTDTCKMAVAPSGASEPAGPAVAVAGNVALVVWRETIDQQSYRLVARRLTGDCKLLDFSPIVIAADSPTWLGGISIPDIATDGTTFFVVWSGRAGVRGARIDASGNVLTDVPIDISAHTGFRRGTPLAPHVVWTGSHYVVAWPEDPSCMCGAPPPLYGYPTSIYAAHVSRNGDRTVRAESPVVTNGGTGGLQIAFAFGAGHPTLVWFARNAPHTAVCLYAAQINADDNQPTAAMPATCSQSLPTWSYQIDMTWTGNAFAVVWDDRWSAPAPAHLLTLNGAARPFGSISDVTPDGVAVSALSVAATRAGLLLGYSRVAPEAANVPRAFTRTIEGIQPTRVRTAPH